jgi:hypothetical protein
MAVTRAAIVARVPALDAVTNPSEWDAAIADAQLQVAASAWGDMYELGVVYLAAHLLLATHPDIEGPGPVQSESVGSVSVSYAVSGSVFHNLMRTSAGREYRRLLRTLGLSVSVV